MTSLQLIQAVRRIKSRSLPELRCLRALWQTFNEFAASCNETALDLAGCTPGVYTRHLLNSSDDDFLVVLLLWGPGAETSIHDHDSAMGAVMPIIGTIHETKYQLVRQQQHRVRLEMMETVRLDALQLTPILPNDDMQVHLMENACSTAAATLHVYLSPLSEFCTYHPADDGSFIKKRKELRFERDNEWRMLDEYQVWPRAQL